jgi:hypothetical protein
MLVSAIALPTLYATINRISEMYHLIDWDEDGDGMEISMKKLTVGLESNRYEGKEKILYEKESMDTQEVMAG